jgi:hypothetical protein
VKQEWNIDMLKLRKLIANHARWSELNIYLDRIESARESDFSLALENLKALLGSISNEICDARGRQHDCDLNMNRILKDAFSALGYSNADMVTRISSALATIGQSVGELRNEIGATAYGRALEEIRRRNEQVDLLTRDFLLDSAVTVAIFLIRSFEERTVITSSSNNSTSDDKSKYEDFDAFNDYWDELYNEFSMGEYYSYPASLILYYVDNEVYHYESRCFEIEDEAQESE